MRSVIGIEALAAWGLLKGIDNGVLCEPESSYNNGMSLDNMGAEELLSLLIQVRGRLNALGYTEYNLPPHYSTAEPDSLFINKEFIIRFGSAQGPEIKLRPLVKTVFIFFLKHPEGILLKERAEYESELLRIYAVIAPNVSPDDRQDRISRLVNVDDNSFSEKCSVLNATLDRLIKPPLAEGYKVQGTNGYPRRIPLDPLLVTWV